MWLKGTFSVNWKTCIYVFDLLFWLNHAYNLKSCAAPHSPCANLSAHTGFAVHTNLCKNVHGCVWLKIPTEIFFFLCMADSVYKVHIARGCEGVCESRCACFSPLYVIKTVSFVSQQAPVSKNFYPASCVCFILACMETNHSVSDLDIWLLRKWTHNTVMWAVKGNVPWMIFVFFSFNAISTSISNLKPMIVGVCAQHELFIIWLFYISHCPWARRCTCTHGTHTHTQS